VLHFQRLTPRGGARRRKCLIFNSLHEKIFAKKSLTRAGRAKRESVARLLRGQGCDQGLFDLVEDVHVRLGPSERR